jgi:hypothetical protein
MMERMEMCQCCEQVQPKVEFYAELDECWCEQCWQIHCENTLDAIAEQETIRSLKYNI